MSAVIFERPMLPAAWRRALPALLLLLAGILLLYRDTAVAMVTIWDRSGTFTHCFTVLPIVLWLVWRRRDVLAAQTPRSSTWLLLPIAGAAMLWLLGDLAAVNAATQLALVALLVLAVTTVLGVQVAHTIMFPLGFLFFAVPIGEFMMPHMMLWTADFTVFALRLSGIPVYREGQQLVIPSGTWSVVEACSGVRYLIASVMVGTLFAYLNYRSLRRRLAFVGVAIAVPIVANWLRAYLTVVLGHLSNNKLATGVDHLIYGWLFFGIVILLMFAIGARWSEPHSADRPAPATGNEMPSPARHPWRVVAAAALIGLLPHLAVQAIARMDSSGQPNMAPVALAGDWRLSEGELADWKPAFKGAAMELNHTYSANQGRDVGLYIGYYRHQDYDRKLVSSENALVTSNDRRWAQTASGSQTLDVASTPVEFRTARLRGSPSPHWPADKRLVVWQTYWITGTLTASDSLAKGVAALYRLLGRGDDAAVIIVYAPEGEGEGEATAAIEDFLRANLPSIEAQLGKARASR
jgi:exosortase A